ncbi:hypothetical protein P154DRAFT_250780 [Amniculicola lignicola CBS 123094]|uniref:Knr4/Smi1-like domain-containing protein n=1 Tax=Amniculicola lignicola CBS 123094 TaxID=1392246 RepID=A0A6A5WL50_9PLEO|nr:hypothetical protein P154DRAFT_250780 [Amniculicola lignicola CBS 123094]
MLDMLSHRMGRKFDAHHILREKDPEHVAGNLFNVALEFAVLGHIDTSTELYELAEAFSSDCKRSWSPGLYFAWEAVGKWPESIPAKDRSPEALEKLETERIVWKRQSVNKEEEMSALIKRATKGKMDEWGEVQIQGDDLTAAIDLAMFWGFEDKAMEILQIFADNFHSSWDQLPKSRKVWKLLSEKNLSKLIGIDENKMDNFRKEVMETFRERLEKGARRIFKDLPMKDLVQLCNDNTIKNAIWEDMGVDGDDPPTTILRKGATPEQIEALEKKIENTLPDEFKEFLSITNGMESVWNGVFGEPKILGTEEIHIFDATEQQEQWIDSAVKIPFVTTMSVKVEWPPMNRVVQINEGDEESKFLWLIEPEYGNEIGVRFFKAFGQLPPDEREQIQKLLGYFHAGKDANTKLGWQVGVWAPSTLDLITHHSWREYLELLAGDTANQDVYDEEDDEGRLTHSHEIFAYTLR